MSQQSHVALTNAVAVAGVPLNFRAHTIGVMVVGGYVTVEARVPGGAYEPVMDTDTSAPLQMTGTESVSIYEISLDSVRFTPVGGATYSAVITSQAAD